MAEHRFRHSVGSASYVFRNLKELMAKASPARSGDLLAGVAAASAEERAIAQMALAEHR
ncbi:ethanolamine ammonia-lyase subunit EutB, partial [Herbaspirillum sp. B65]|uniref:ethanolamine ammonia-lyase subunit EutB n=1 Tax=Herbaspirillum sp. B65 TaxID=137708 RepID=UPI00131EFF8F